MSSSIGEFAIAEALSSVTEVVRETNGYVERNAPWAEASRSNDD